MYAIKSQKESKVKKVLTDTREDYMAVQLATGETRVVHRNLGDSLVKKGVAKELKATLERSDRVREAQRRAAREAQKENTATA